MAAAPLLLTGGTGFLGGRIAQALVARGETVRLLTRSGSVPEVAGPGTLVPVRGDITEPDAVARAARGCRAAIHSAARVSRGGSRADFVEVNVGGLENMLRATASAGLERVVLTSSFFALGPVKDGSELDESSLSESAPDLDHYQASKRDAALLARRASEAGAPLVTLYPGVIVGPGRLTDGNFIAAMVRDHLRGRLVALPVGGRRTWSFVHVEDVVAGHLAALDRAALGTSYVLGGENSTLRELFGLVAGMTGRRAPRLSASRTLMWGLGAGEEAVEALTGRAPRQLTRGVARVLACDWALCSDAARRDLGHAPRKLPVILSETLAWLEAAGEIPRGMLRPFEAT